MGIERWDSGSEGRLPALNLPEAEEAAEWDSALVAASGSSWGGNVGDMILLAELFYRYLVTEFLLTTVNVHTKLDLTRKFVNRTEADCSILRGRMNRGPALRASARGNAVIPSNKT